jgi:hypothetical protein
MPSRARIKSEGLARIARSRENDVRKDLLTECFNNYLELSPGDEPEYERLQAEQFPEAKTVVNSIEERGRVRERREIVRKQVDKKFGQLPINILAQIESLPVNRLEGILLAILDAKSLDELGLTV